MVPFPYRVVLRLLEYSPALRQRYMFRIRIETTEQFAALPYDLRVDYQPSQNVHRFAIRGLGISHQLQSSAQSAAYTHDFAILSDGNAVIVIERAPQLCTIHLRLEHGRWIVEGIEPPDVIHVEIEDSIHPHQPL
ncbi:MAG: hypothetical protein KatS3mg039_0715 [Candidatus Kapaibacterium sp.]|nr:MAG: hypothetical protein KatS3mg039_0715 [Candidatus Kapabacteria bacterium]